MASTVSPGTIVTAGRSPWIKHTTSAPAMPESSVTSWRDGWSGPAGRSGG